MGTHATSSFGNGDVPASFHVQSWPESCVFVEGAKLRSNWLVYCQYMQLPDLVCIQSVAALHIALYVLHM